jgi:hypothetical protein
VFGEGYDKFHHNRRRGCRDPRTRGRTRHTGPWAALLGNNPTGFTHDSSGARSLRHGRLELCWVRRAPAVTALVLRQFGRGVKGLLAAGLVARVRAGPCVRPLMIIARGWMGEPPVTPGETARVSLFTQMRSLMGTQIGTES